MTRWPVSLASILLAKPHYSLLAEILFPFEYFSLLLIEQFPPIPVQPQALEAGIEDRKAEARTWQRLVDALNEQVRLLLLENAQLTQVRSYARACLLCFRGVHLPRGAVPSVFSISPSSLTCLLLTAMRARVAPRAWS